VNRQDAKDAKDKDAKEMISSWRLGVLGGLQFWVAQPLRASAYTAAA
jgi:hypothetical protein